MANKTQQALRELLYATFTSPQLTYQIDGQLKVNKLPVANVIPRSVWLAGGMQAPMPCIAYSVEEREFVARSNVLRNFMVHIWCISTNSEDECTELFEQVRARLHLSDSESPVDISIVDKSRAATASNLGIAVAFSKFKRSYAVDFDIESKRWYIKSEFEITAS